ncbi:MAG: AAA family ATPase [Patescibacteria group bacterium]
MNLAGEAKEIKKLKEKINFPISILIGGVFGVGKTSLSYNLSFRLGIKQRTSVGVITKTLRFLEPMDSSLRGINQLDKDTDEFPLFFKQAEKICSIVDYILKISRKDGVDYIIDGVQLMPQYLDLDNHSFFIFLKSPKAEELKERLNRSTTHPLRYRETTLRQVKKLIKLEKLIISDIKESASTKILDSALEEDEVLVQSLDSIKSWLKSLV